MARRPYSLFVQNRLVYASCPDIIIKNLPSSLSLQKCPSLVLLLVIVATIHIHLSHPFPWSPLTRNYRNKRERVFDFPFFG